MNPSFRVWWLIIVACFVFHLSGWHTAVVLIPYAIAEFVDRWRKFALRRDVFAEVMLGWKQCKDDPEHEEKGDSTRVRLVGQNQVIVARLMELLALKEE